MLHTHGMVLEELVILLHGQETEGEQQQKGQGPTCQCAQDVLFPGLSGNYQAEKWRVTWFKLLSGWTWACSHQEEAQLVSLMDNS